MKPVTLTDVIQDYNSRGFLLRPAEECFGSLRCTFSDVQADSFGPVMRSDFKFGYADDSEDNHQARAHFNKVALKTKLVRILDSHHPSRRVTPEHLPCYGLLYDHPVSVSSFSPCSHYIGTYVGDLQLLQNSKLPLVPQGSRSRASKSHSVATTSSHCPLQVKSGQEEPRLLYTPAASWPRGPAEHVEEEYKCNNGQADDVASGSEEKDEEADMSQGFDEGDMDMELDDSSNTSSSSGSVDGTMDGSESGGDIKPPSLYVSVALDCSDVSSDNASRSTTAAQPTRDVGIDGLNPQEDCSTATSLPRVRATDTDAVRDKLLKGDRDSPTDIDYDKDFVDCHSSEAEQLKDCTTSDSSLSFRTAHSLARLSSGVVPSADSSCPPFCSTTLASLSSVLAAAAAPEGATDCYRTAQHDSLHTDLVQPQETAGGEGEEGDLLMGSEKMLADDEDDREHMNSVFSSTLVSVASNDCSTGLAAISSKNELEFQMDDDGVKADNSCSISHVKKPDFNVEIQETTSDFCQHQVYEPKGTSLQLPQRYEPFLDVIPTKESIDFTFSFSPLNSFKENEKHLLPQRLARSASPSPPPVSNERLWELASPLMFTPVSPKKRRLSGNGSPLVSSPFFSPVCTPSNLSHLSWSSSSTTSRTGDVTNTALPSSISPDCAPEVTVSPERLAPPSFPRLLCLEYPPQSSDLLRSTSSLPFTADPSRDFLFPILFIHWPLFNFSNNALCASSKTYSSFFLYNCPPQNNHRREITAAKGGGTKHAVVRPVCGKSKKRMVAETAKWEAKVGRKKLAQAPSRQPQNIIYREGGLSPLSRRFVLPWHPQLVSDSSQAGQRLPDGECGEMSSKLRSIIQHSSLTLDGRTGVCPMSFMSDSWSTGLTANCRLCVMYIFDWLPQLVCVSIPGLQINQGDELICDYEFLFGPAWQQTRKTELSANVAVSLCDLYRTNLRCLSSSITKFAQS
eukprot:GHVS01083187.1.p1 GENE.GHVS01083187.1~~GHVS01083187.1.p1  ORF type:complete len:964 (+),score=135.28 GHVS01083187.1:265-3156(+)